MGENELLRAARERTESRRHAGERLSRHELAELANAHLWARHGRKVELDAHYVAKLERGVIRWPNARYREAFRAILGNASDAELGFVNPRRAAEPVREDSVATPVPRQLPPASVRFTGRAAELAVLGECGAGVTVLSGAGGIGKTSLALHWAHDAAGRFPDGQLFADLRGFGPDGPPVDPSVVLGGFLRALGVAAAEIPADSTAQQGLYRSLLAGKRVLVVLDNASDTAQVLPLLPGADSCAAVITSRRVLTGVVTAVGAHHLAVDPLGDDQAHALLERHLGVARPAAEPAATAELVRLCGGFPLALAVFAARAAASPRVPLAAFAAELRDLGLGAFENDDPAASLPAVLSWSCRALTEQERFVFAHLGIAPGQDVGLASVVNLTALRPAQVRKALRGLTEASLVTRNARDRYALHDLVRQHAATWLPGTPEPALRRLTDFQLATGHAAERLLAPHRPPQVVFPEVTPHHADLPADATAALAWFEDEHQSLLAAQHAALERKWHDVVWCMAWVLHTYTYRHGQLSQRIATWEAALAVAGHLDEPVRAVVHRYAGNAYVDAQRAEEGVWHLRRALDLAERQGDALAIATTHHDLAGAWEERGDDRRALAHARHALDLFRTFGNPVWEAFALNDAGWYAARVGDHDTARRHCREALELHRRHGNPVGEAATLDSLGYSHHHGGEHELAAEHYREALDLYRAIDHPFQVARTLGRLGDAYAAAGAHDSAREVWREALDLLRAQRRTREADRVRVRLDRLRGVGGLSTDCQRALPT